jgi:hypothetical protein
MRRRLLHPSREFSFWLLPWWRRRPCLRSTEIIFAAVVDDGAAKALAIDLFSSAAGG